MTVPTRPQLFHITHVDNLQSIVVAGGLHSDAAMIARNAGVATIVNTVNCVGIMGRGIAAQFKRAYPANFRVYEAACERGEVQPGRMLVFQISETTSPGGSSTSRPSGTGAPIVGSRTSGVASWR